MAKMIDTQGMVYDDDKGTMEVATLHCIMSNDALGKTLSINDEHKQFTVRVSGEIEAFFKGDSGDDETVIVS